MSVSASRMNSGMSSPYTELASLINDHIRDVRLLQLRLDKLRTLRYRRQVSESLYKGILEEVRRTIGLMDSRKDVLMDLVDEQVALLEKVDPEPGPADEQMVPFGRNSVGELCTLNLRQGRGEKVGERRCIVCGTSNPEEVNFCISCAAKLPLLGKVEERIGAKSFHSSM